MINAFAMKPQLQSASRLPQIATSARISQAELACLFACGAVAALCVGMIHLPVRLPGHAILRGALPMALGFALVSRRLSGSVMSLSATMVSAAMATGGIGRFPPAALLSVAILGPALDALVTDVKSRQVYLRFALAGAGANLIAFAARLAMTSLGWDLPGAQQFTSFWSFALLSFLLCGAFAGLLSSAIWFRLRVEE